METETKTENKERVEVGPEEKSPKEKINPDFEGAYESSVLESHFEHKARDATVVKVQKVHKQFILGEQTIKILRGVDVDIQRGEFVMLMGPSGCGKSTLLHIVYGLEPPTEGDVYVEDESIWEHTKNWRAFFRNQYIGFIPQQAFWIKSLSVIENVAIPGFIGGKGYRETIERAYKTLEIVGMQEWAHYGHLTFPEDNSKKWPLPAPFFSIQNLSSLTSRPEILTKNPACNLWSSSKISISVTESPFSW